MPFNAAVYHQKLTKEPNESLPKKSQLMTEMLSFKPATITPLKKQSFMDLLQKNPMVANTPLLSGLLTKLNSAASSTTEFIELQKGESDALYKAITDIKWIKVILKSFDFIQTPVLYLMHAIAGDKPPPFTKSRGAEWLYSAILLGLVITTVAAPITAPFIAIAMAGIGLGTSLLTMIKTVYQPYRIKKQLAAVEHDISTQTEKLNELLKDTLRLESQLDKTTSANQRTALSMQLNDLESEFNTVHAEQKEHLQSLYDKKGRLEEELKASQTASKPTAILDKGLSVALACAAVIGAALSLAFPATGLIILSASALIGASYIFARLTNAFIQWATKKTSPPVVNNVAPSSDASPETSPSNDKQLSPTQYPVAAVATAVSVAHSTAKTLDKLHISHHRHSFFAEDVATKTTEKKPAPAFEVVIKPGNDTIEPPTEENNQPSP